MSWVSVCALLSVVAAGVAAQDAAPPPSAPIVPVAAADEVIVFEGLNYRGEWMRLKVGTEVPDLRKSPGGNWGDRITSVKVGTDAVAVLYSSADFSGICLGLPGASFGGAGYYPNLSKVKNKDLFATLRDYTRSVRVLGNGTDLAKACAPPKRTK